MGWSTAKGDLQGPVGYDIYSYSYRSVTGQKFWRARGKSFGEPFGPGDIIGCMIKITDQFTEKKIEPDLPKARKKKNAKWAKEVTIFSKKNEESQIHEIMVDSEVIFFKNGICQGTAFTDIIKGEYYPAVSLFGGAECNLNFGTKFSMPVSWKHKYNDSVLPVCSVVPSEHPKPKDPQPPLVPISHPIPTSVPQAFPQETVLIDTTEQKKIETLNNLPSSPQKLSQSPTNKDSPSKFSHLLNPSSPKTLEQQIKPEATEQIKNKSIEERKSFKLEAILSPFQ